MMHHRLTQLRVEDLESRLVAGSYFGGPTGGGLATPWLGFLGKAAAQPPAHPAAGTSRPAGSVQSSGADGSPLRTRDGTGEPRSSRQDGGRRDGSLRVAPATSQGSRVTTPAAAEFDASLVLTDGSELTPGLESPSRMAHGRPAPLGGVSPATSADTAADNVSGQTGHGSVAPGSPTAPPAAVPASRDAGASRFDENLAVVNTLDLSGAGNGNSGPDRAMFDGLSIPHHHARIWWNRYNLAQARTYYAQNPIHPQQNDALGNALLYVLNGDTTAANYAINSLMNFTISDAELQSVASDTYRWSGWVPIVFDWVHNAMTPAQIQTFTDRYNYYAFTMMNKSWGGPTMPANNYFWGYFANELNWALATYYENPMAQTFLDDALVTRWQNSFVPWAEGPGRGGVTPEGTEYGRVDLSYPALPLTAAALLGGEQYGQTNYYAEAVFNLIYSTTPAPTYSKESPTNPYYMPFPFGEDEHNGGYPSFTDTTYYGDFLQAAANAYGDSPVAQYAYHWLQTVQPPQTFYTIPAYQNTPTYHPDMYTPDFSSLPVDYYAPGAQDFYTRNQWGPQATSVFLQLGSPGPNVLDSGSFQIWRNGWFVSKETTGYDLQINGGFSEDPVAHNTLLFGGQGIARAWRNGDPQVLRLQSDPVFSYAAVDMSPAFGSSYPSLNNPYAAHAVREFLFIKPLETMVILDRMESSDAAIPAEDVTKTFLVHFPNQPQVTGANTVVGVSGNQALSLTTLLPGNPNYNVVDESAFSGQHDPDPAFYQYRLEENTSGSAQSYFLNVLQARGAHGRDVVSNLSQDASSWTITLDDPSLGHAKIVLNKGMDSQGGAVGYSPTGTPTELTPLLDHVQGIQVTDVGPVWGS